MNTLKYLSIAVLLGTWGCSQKQIATKGDYDDVYGSSADAPEVVYKPQAKYQNPDYAEHQRYQAEELQVSHIFVNI